MGLKRRNVRSINEKENNKIEICASEENKEDVKEVTTEKVELANDMIKTPIEPINELTDTIEEDTNVAEEKEVENSNVEKEDIAKIIEEENNKSEEDKKVICLDTGIVYENSKDAESKTVAKSNAITRCCNGNCKKAGKLRWQYYKDYLLEK
nr:MAG TPA_asm: hypothetical protein [Caudoviricetes sp.]